MQQILLFALRYAARKPAAQGRIFFLLLTADLKVCSTRLHPTIWISGLPVFA